MTLISVLFKGQLHSNCCAVWVCNFKFQYSFTQSVQRVEFFYDVSSKMTGFPLKH